MRECLLPQNLPEALQQWLLMDGHLRLLAERYALNIHVLDEKVEVLRVTRPPFFQYKTRQLVITEEQKIEAQKLAAQADARRVEEAARRGERIVVAKLSELILALDRDSATEADEILDTARRFARANWVDEQQNDHALPYILDELAKLDAPPPTTPVVASVYGKDQHPKAVATDDPWAKSE